MSKIRLHGSSSGYMEIAPPAAGSSATITLPNSAGEVLLSDGSAASLTQIPAANLVGVCTAGLTRTGGFGKFASYAIICDRKSNGTDGGSLVSGGWRVRDLNHEIADEDGIVSIASNRFTLQAGTYLIKANAPQYGRGYHALRLYNYTDSSTVADGQSNFANYNDNIYNSAFVWGRTTISSAKEFEILHRCSESSGGSSNGAGVGAGAGFVVNYEIYTVVEIYKEA